MKNEIIPCDHLAELMDKHKLKSIALSSMLMITNESFLLKLSGCEEWLFKEMLLLANLFGLSEVKDLFPEIYNHVLNSGFL
ncbi:MAG: hypothetical protein WC454_05575 [Phycisphaerae bacterium]|jgi:hypothetical protein